MFNFDKYYIDCYVDSSKSRWNWGAFIFGPLWLFYRRMYSYGFFYFTIMLLELALNYYFTDAFINISAFIMHIIMTP